MSSLLVRDGLVGVKRMEKAFQRQVIYGGSLDTILLEMSLVPEERLTQYLALASGLPPAARDEGRSIEPAALELISRELAELYRAVPVALTGEVVRILVCAPLEMSALEDLADMLDRPLQPLITPEYRWHLVYAAAYGIDVPARYTTLARTIDSDQPQIAPVGRAASIIVEGAPAASIPSIAPIAPDQPTMRLEAPPTPPPSPADTFEMPPVDLPAEPELAGRRGRSTILGMQPQRADSGPSAGVPKPVTPEVPDTRESRPSGKFGRLTPPPSKPLKRPATSAIDTSGRDEPLTTPAARELLATAGDRDTIFLTLLRAVRARARWAGLLTVQGGAAVGRVALAEPGLDILAINTVLIPLDAMSPFRTVISNGQPHVGPLVSGDPSIDSMVLRFGGTVPPSALILPILLRERAVALVVAHRVHGDLKLADVTELLPMATAAADAISRLIVQAKSAGYRASDPGDAATGAPNVELDGDVDTRRINRTPGSWQASGAGTNETVQVDLGPDLAAASVRPIETVLGDIELAPEGGSDRAIAEAVARPSEALGELMRRFPGRLRVDRFAVNGRPLRASQYGGLLELVVRLGAIASELLIDKMGAPQRDVRFYATVCAAELRPRNAVFALVERVFDQDFGVRACAIEALAGYPPADLRNALLRARRAIHSDDPETVAAATAAVVELGDVEAIPDLIGAVERGDRAAEHATRALIGLTAQDFGASERKWRKWWETSRKKHRIEWLIEGLGHREDAIRENAINDLRRLTGEYFGYHHDLPRRDRDLARDRWVAWWREVGQRRFTAVDDERTRPTAQLPQVPPARKD